MAMLMGILLAAAAAQPAPPTQAQRGEEVVVTGRRANTRANLEACLARNCPPNEDIDATLGHAEALFEGGDYEEAHRTISASISRNRNHAARYPEPVSDLYRSHARVSAHMGRDDAVRRSTYQILRSLQAGIPQEDHRHFTARLEISDMLARAGQLSVARRELDRLADNARGAGRMDVEAVARMRSLWLQNAMEPQGPARSEMIRLANSEDTDQRLMAVAARMMLARIYRAEGNAAQSDAMIARLGSTRSSRRSLVHAPPITLPFGELSGEDGEPASSNVLSRVSAVTEDAWVDVGYWIQADGHVADVQVLRRGARDDWARSLLDSIRGRRYTAAPDGRPSYRLERYTLTAPYEVRTGSRMQQRSPRARIEFVDLTRYEEQTGT